MRRSLVLLLILGACTEPSPNDEEVGETDSESEGDDVATFTTSDDDTTTSESTDGTDTTESSESTTDTTDDAETDTTESTETSESTTDTTDATETSTETETSSETETSTDVDDATTDDEPPFVLATNPDDLQTGVSPETKLEITFSEVMDAGTITTNVGEAACSGTLQLSTDGFASCVPMMGPPTSGDDQVFTLTPVAPLSSATDFQFRVLAQVTDVGGTAMLEDFVGQPFVIRYYHTITIDGVNDFGPDEAFGSSSLGHGGFVAWDDTYLYLGMDSPDLGGNSSQVWWVAYLGGPFGTNTGVLYNTQQPSLPFEAQWHLRWKASDDYGGALQWTGMTWTDPGFGPTVGSDDVGQAGSFVEVRVAWSDIMSPDMLGVHMGMLREQAFNEASWAAVPAGSYVDGYDPNYSQWFEFDVLGSTVPADHSPL